MTATMLQFQRISASPVLAKGGTYDTWVADAMADPSVCWDAANFRYAMVVSLWDNTRSKWASAFYTSTDLATWSYVSGSLQTPAGSNYLFGNGGLIKFTSGTYSGLYGHVYNTYPSASSSGKIFLDTSPDLVTWTNRSTGIIAFGTPDSSDQADPMICLNPVNSRYEVWYAGGSDVTNGRPVMMCDSPDGSTWTRRGSFVTPDAWNKRGIFGEPFVYYLNGARYLTTDTGGADGYRLVERYIDASANGSFVPYGSCLSGNAANAWEAQQTFDSSPIVTDRGDSRGTKVWMLYAGSDTNSATDNTDSSIGLVYLDIPASFTPLLPDYQYQPSRAPYEVIAY